MTHEPRSYTQADGGLDRTKSLQDFRDFFRRHSEHWIQRFAYRESGPQLLLQRVANGGGRIERECGLGRLRTDLLVVWPVAGKSEECAIECKIRRGSLERTIRAGVRQTAAYMDRCDAREGHLVIFDRGAKASKDKAYRSKEDSPAGPVHVWGMGNGGERAHRSGRRSSARRGLGVRRAPFRIAGETGSPAGKFNVRNLGSRAPQFPAGVPDDRPRRRTRVAVGSRTSLDPAPRCAGPALQARMPAAPRGAGRGARPPALQGRIVRAARSGR